MVKKQHCYVVTDHEKHRYWWINLIILELSKIVIYGFWYDYVKPKYSENIKLCCMDTGRFIVHVKSDDIYTDIAKDIDTRFDISNYELKRPLKNKMVIGFMKDQ